MNLGVSVDGLMDLTKILERLRHTWARVPEQVKRLGILFAIIVIVFIPVRGALVPKDFGKLGHYRASALGEIASLDINYAGHGVCNDCHDDIVAIKAAGYHHNVACEVCHGPSNAHVDDPEAFTPVAPRQRGYCPLCLG